MPVVAAIVTFVSSFAVSEAPISIPTSEKTKSAREERHRRDLLKRVKNDWIKDVLKRSLNDKVLIELGLEERGDAVYNRQGIELQISGHPNRPLPPGTKIVDVFDELGPTLLIMGKPGSGKTTMLLELARDTIARAEEEPIHEIPVVFNLSSWTDPKQPIADWLVDELNTNYDIQKKIASDWIEHNDLLLLLDGLDEVLPERREACARAINDFRSRDPGRAPLVICCRIEEYEAIPTRLNLENAICLQPLTEKQVDDYLYRLGQELTALRMALKDDQILYELAQTPLMLSIMILAYGGMSVHDLQPPETIDARRKHIFDNYVERMFNPRKHRTLLDYPEIGSTHDRKQDDRRFSKEETIHWLSWLARRMSQHGQTVFLIERMQPDWLPTRAQQIVTVGTAAMVGLLGGLIFGLFVGMVGGLLVGIIFGLLTGQMFMQYGYSKNIRPVERLRLSWLEMLYSLFIGLLAGMVVGMVVGIMFGLLIGIVVGMVVGLIFGLLTGMSSGVVEQEEIVTRKFPNDGVHRSARSALFFGLLGGLLFGMVVGLLFGIKSGLIDGLFVGFWFWLFFGPVTWLRYGGRACIQHIVLRIMLWRGGSAPLNYVRFLDCAAGRIFLRKVGGGYIFVHRLLLEYFASLEPEEEVG
jgi:DNA polymerase III delta prime subunit